MKLEDFVGRRHDRRWGSMRYTKSLKDMVGSAEGKRWQERALAERQSKQGTRPSHLIRPDEVDAWLADSVNEVVTYHRTDSASADDLARNGVQIERNVVGAYGQGFYTARRPIEDRVRGDVDVPVAVRLKRPFTGHADEVSRFLDDLIILRFGRLRPLDAAVAHSLREQLVDLGYDGIIIEDADGESNTYVIAFAGDAVKVVRR